MTTPDTPERAALVAAKKAASDAWMEANAAWEKAAVALRVYDAAYRPDRPDRRSGRDRRTEAK